MMALHASAEQLLRSIVSAGDRGLQIPLDRRGDLAALIRDDLVSAPPITEPRVTFATERGRAYALRDAHA